MRDLKSGCGKVPSPPLVLAEEEISERGLILREIRVELRPCFRQLVRKKVYSPKVISAFLSPNKLEADRASNKKEAVEQGEAVYDLVCRKSVLST